MTRSRADGLPLLDDPRWAVRGLARAAVSLLCAASALGAGRLLEPTLLRPYVLPAALAFIVAAVVAGTGAGILTSAAFAAGHALIHLAPRGSFSLHDPRELSAVLGYFVAGTSIAVVGGALRDAYDRLREDNRLLQEAHARREDLLSALSHDVRSPLSVITTSAALLARHAGEEDAGSVRRRARTIEASAASIAAMLQDLMDATTLESGHVMLQRQRVEPTEFLTAVKDRLAGAEDVARVKVVIPPGLPTVNLDPPRFERVLVNLVTNALKYSPPGSPVVLGATATGRELLVSVADEGPGIAPQDLPRIFDKYYRSSDARSHAAGHGLGLFIARMLVEAHGGRIWADANASGGTTFHIALPPADADAGPHWRK